MTDPAQIQSFPSSVRQPSHLAPPFRSRQWTQNPGDDLYIVMNPANPRVVWGINWSGPLSTTNPVLTGGFQTGEPFPTGMRGVYAYHETIAETGNSGVLAPGHIKWSIFKNGSPVPGWLRTNVGEQWSIVGGGRTRTNKITTIPILVPITLEEGDQLDVVLELFGPGATVSWLNYWTCSGWIYPVTVEGDAGSIRGTLADPGIAHPLRDPFGSPQPPRRIPRGDPRDLRRRRR